MMESKNSVNQLKLDRKGNNIARIFLSQLKDV